jgi:hypothetical protein
MTNIIDKNLNGLQISYQRKLFNFSTDKLKLKRLKKQLGSFKIKKDNIKLGDGFIIRCLISFLLLQHCLDIQRSILHQ